MPVGGLAHTSELVADFQFLEKMGDRQKKIVWIDTEKVFPRTNHRAPGAQIALRQPGRVQQIAAQRGDHRARNAGDIKAKRTMCAP